MNKRFVAYLLTLSSDHRDVWMYLWSKSDDKGIVRASANSIAVALGIHREVVRRVVNYDPASPFYMVGRPILAQEDQSRWNTRELSIEFFLEKEIEESFSQPQIPLHVSKTPPVETPEEIIAKKVSQNQSEGHWIDKYIKENLPNVAKIKTQMTDKQCEKISQRYDEALVISKLKSMENYVRGTKQIKVVYQIYSSVFETLKEWCARELKKREGHTGGQAEIALAIAKKEKAGNFSRIVEANESIKDQIEKGNILLKK